MSIANELSCDVAAAMLAQREASPTANTSPNLREIVMEFHSTLRRLTNDERERRRAHIVPPRATNKAAASR